MLRIEFHPPQGDPVPCPMPPEGSRNVEVPGATCPACRVPLVAFGVRPACSEYEVRSEARCATCDDKVGTLVVQTGSLFGRSEDERVLQGRCRVY